MTPVVWAACACHVWPLEPTAKVDRCGHCRQYPSRPVEAPADGKAHPL